MDIHKKLLNTQLNKAYFFFCFVPCLATQEAKISQISISILLSALSTKLKVQARASPKRQRRATLTAEQQAPPGGQDNE